MGVIMVSISGEPTDVEAATQYLLETETTAPRKVLYSSDYTSPFIGTTRLRRYLEIEILETEPTDEESTAV